MKAEKSFFCFTSFLFFSFFISVVDSNGSFSLFVLYFRVIMNEKRKYVEIVYTNVNNVGRKIKSDTVESSVV